MSPTRWLNFPLLAAAMARGELSYSKVRAITRIVTPATEADLLSIALAGTSNQVERIVSAYRRSEAAAEDGEERAFGDRSLYAITSGDTMEFTVRVPVEAGKALMAAIERSVATDLDEPVAARRADALVDLAEHAVAHAATPAVRDEPVPGDRTSIPRCSPVDQAVARWPAVMDSPTH